MEAQANQKQVNVRVADAASATANVKLARANMETAELNLSYTTIVAPMDAWSPRRPWKWDRSCNKVRD